MGGRNLSHSILLIFHVFFSNILLMNYLIAILSTTYDNMRETGIFKYKMNLYQYCERFMIAFEERSYGEMVLHPPPLSYISAFLIPFTPFKFIMRYISQSFSLMMYWIENIVFIIGFLLFENVIAPIAYIKIWINIIGNSYGVLKTIMNCLICTSLAPALVAYLILKDVGNLMKILCYLNGCRYGKVDELEDDLPDSAIRVRVYNETRSTVIQLYKRLQKYMKQNREDEVEDEDEDDVFEEQDFFHIDDDENMNEDFLYVVKKSLIIEEWKKRRLLIEKRQRFLNRS